MSSTYPQNHLSKRAQQAPPTGVDYSGPQKVFNLFNLIRVASRSDTNQSTLTATDLLDLHCAHVQDDYVSLLFAYCKSYVGSWPGYVTAANRDRWFEINVISKRLVKFFIVNTM